VGLKKTSTSRWSTAGTDQNDLKSAYRLPSGHSAVDHLLVEVFLQAHQEAPEEIILDLDAPTIRYTGSRKGVSSMATTDTTATYRCTFSVESFCCVRGCDRRTSMPQQEV